jgi:membrane protein DedA with SNARE-associated domain
MEKRSYSVFTLSNNLRRRINIVNVSISLIFVFFILLSIYAYNFYDFEIRHQISSYGLIGLAFVIFLIEIIPSMFNPHLIFLMASPLLGVIPALLSVLVGSFIGSIFAFWLGRRYGKTFIYPLVNPKTIFKIQSFWEKYGKWFVFFAAFTPLPYMPIIFGALGMSARQFFIFGILARLGSILILGVGLFFGLSFFF